MPVAPDVMVTQGAEAKADHEHAGPLVVRSNECAPPPTGKDWSGSLIETTVQAAPSCVTAWTLPLTRISPTRGAAEPCEATSYVSVAGPEPLLPLGNVIQSTEAVADQRQALVATTPRLAVPESEP